MKKDLDIKEVDSIESSMTLWLKEEISQIIMAPEENQFMEKNSLTKTSRLSMTNLIYYQWPMQDQGLMVLNSSSPL